MARKFLLASSVAATVAAGLLLASTPAYADDITTFTATVEPEVVKPGESVTVTLTVTNETHRKITYDPIVAPEEFADCAQDVGTLKPEESKQVTCSAVITKESPLTATFSIQNAKSEHHKTQAEATIHIELKEKPDEPTKPVEPTTTPPQEPEVNDQPTLPITGSSLTPLLAAGAGLLLVGLVLVSRPMWRRN